MGVVFRQILTFWKEKHLRFKEIIAFLVLHFGTPIHLQILRYILHPALCFCSSLHQKAGFAKTLRRSK